MAASDHLNPGQLEDYVRLHRGFAGKFSYEIDKKNLGHHWVSDEQRHVAEAFAIDHASHLSRRGQGIGTILTGLVHKNDLLEPGSEEHEKWANEGFGAAEGENEVPLRKGTPVRLIGASDFINDKPMIFHTYNEPIEGKA
jgi:hypothetical protein